jgi:hypothetical protein
MIKNPIQNKNKMERIIEYTESISKPFQKYVDIGWCECHYESLCLFDPKSEETYKDWYKRLLNESHGSQILNLNFLLRELNSGGESYFKDEYGNKIKDIIVKNFETLKRFDEKWFEEDAPLFKGLDFGSFEKEDEIIESIEDENGIRSLVIFEDGSSIRFLDDDDRIYSYYILESEFENFRQEINNIIRLFE